MHYRLRPILFLLFFAPAAHAGAWLQQQGHGLVSTQANYYTTNRYFDRGGHLTSQSRYGKYELSPYAEYGLLPNLTVGATGYLQRDTQSGTSNTGLADPQVFVRSRIWHDAQQTVSLQPLVKFKSGFEHEGAPRGGSSSTDLELSALYGRSLHLVSARDYADLRIGYRQRGNDLNAQWLGDAALGLQVAPQWLLVPAVRIVQSTGVSDSAFSENGDLDYDLTKAELTAYYQYDTKNWLQFGGNAHIAGKQAGDGFGLTLGYLRFF